MKTTDEIRRAGLDALRRELGAVGTVRFLQLFENGSSDYTRERRAALDTESANSALLDAQAADKGKLTKDA